MSKERDFKLQQVTDWATANETIRAALITSSLVNPYAPVDRFSDLDIELVVKDLGSFLADNSWIEDFGEKIAMVAEEEDAFDGKHAMRMVLYKDYVKIDFKLWSVAGFLKEVQAQELYEDWDIGYKVLLDKDGLTTAMQPPTYQSVVIRKPEQERYDQVLNDLWWDMTYVAKCLWREELFFAKFMLEDNMRTQYLVPMIEWYIGMQHSWNVTTNKYGRLFKKYLTPELWTRVEVTFSGSSSEDNWRALWAYAALGRELGQAIAARLGYHYPTQLDKDICTYLEYVQSLPRE